MKVYDVIYQINYRKHKEESHIKEEGDNKEVEYEYTTTKKFRTVIPEAVSNHFFMMDTFEFGDSVRQQYRKFVKKGLIEATTNNIFSFDTLYLSTKSVSASDKTIKQTIKKDVLRILISYFNSRKDDINLKDEFFEFCDKNGYEYFEDYECFVDWDIKRIAKQISKRIDTDGLFIEELGEDFNKDLFAMSLDATNSELRYFNQYISNFVKPELYCIYMLLFPNAAINCHKYINLPHLF